MAHEIREFADHQETAQEQSQDLCKVWRATCGGCGVKQLITADSKSDAISILRWALGWRRTKSGWRCPNCGGGDL
jgi:ribosomal protein S27AE